MDDQQASHSQDPNAGGQPTPPTPPAPPAGDQGAAPQGAQPKSDLGGIMEENVDVSSLIQSAGNQQAVQDFIAKTKVPEHPNTQFNEQEFVQLLAGSISLTMGEKDRIIQAIPKLSQFQVDELIKIFKEEQQKFQELEKKHAEEVAKLEAQHAEGMQDSASKKEEEEAKAKEAQEAEDIKKNLGL